MSSESDYRQQWADLLDISEELLTADTALIISSDRSKKILLGDEDTDPDDDWPKSLYTPVDYEDLASLYQLGMQRKADLFIQYALRKDGLLLLEDVGILDGLNLTKYPSRKFEDWTVPPSFLSIDSKGFDPRVHSVQRWRRRVYVFGGDRFMELTWHPYVNGWERIDKYRFSSYKWSGCTSPDELLNSRALLESLVASDKIRLPIQTGQPVNDTRAASGGRQAIFNPTEDQIDDFGPKYKEAYEKLNAEMVARQRKQYGRYNETERWYLLKRVFPDAPDELLRIMRQENNASRAVLQYAAWRISVPIGAWRHTQLYELLEKSKQV